MSLKEQYPDIGEGWSSMLEKIDGLNTVLCEISVYKGIHSIERSNGMLKINFAVDSEVENHYLNFIQHSIAYRIERLTAQICEDCGRRGNRRVELATVQTLCVPCYAVKYSDMLEARS